MSWVHVYRLQLVMQATSRQCSWSTIKSEVRSWTTQPNYDMEYTTQVIQEIPLCDAELQRIMSWMHACRQQVIQVTFRQCSMMEFDRTPHNLWRGMLHSCRSRDITVQPRTVENNQLDAFTHGTGHTGNVSLVFQVTFHQCFRQPFTNVSGNLSPVFQATFHSVSWWSLIVHHTWNMPLRSFKRLSLCNVELQRIMNWVHVCTEATGYTGSFSSVFHDGRYEWSLIMH